MVFLSCNSSKYLEDGQQLYTGAEIELNSPYSLPQRAQLLNKVENVLRPEPNATFLGMRPSLWIYNVAGETKKETGIRHFIKSRLGNPPVLYDEVNPGFVSELIQNRLYNNGYFDSRVNYEILEPGKKKVRVKYTADVTLPYRYDSIFYPIDTHFRGKILHEIAAGSLLEKGDIYDIQNLRDERSRIDRKLKSEGFYYFNTDHIYIKADTTSKSGIDHERTVDLFIGLEKNIPREATRRYFMNEIYIYPGFQLGDPDTLATADTIKADGYTYIDNDEENEFRPSAIIKKINLRKGSTYSTYDHEFTINRLMGMGAFKYVDVRFEELRRKDTSFLNAHIYMTPLPKKNLSGRVTMVSKSNNYAGPGLELGWKHRNAFGGAELLRINMNGGFETQLWGDEVEGTFSEFSSYQFGVNANISFPTFIVPFRTDPSTKYVPHTNFGLGYELVNRLRFFRLSSISFTSGYRWRETIKKEHNFNPLIFRYITLSNVSDDFQMLLDENPFLARSFAEQFIIGPEYSYTFNDQMDEDLNNHVYFTASANFSNPFSIFGPDFSAYYRFSSDFRYYYKLSPSSNLVGRIAGGIGVPYGDSESMPYVKQFFTGGPNSIRAFRARSVGPGSAEVQDTDGDIGFQDQNGNIKIELNLEYRFDIYSIFKGALFMDAGNIWLLEEQEGLPGGKFEGSDFINEFAVGAGVGLRIDISYFVLRLDLAWPLRKPFLPEGERWVRPFRDEHPVFNIAIGYPF